MYSNIVLSGNFSNIYHNSEKGLKKKKNLLKLYS